MRKPLRNALGAVLGTVLVSATMAVSPAPAFADECATATPLDARTEVGALDAAAPSLWRTYEIDSETVSLGTPDGSAILEVRTGDCSTVLCTDRSSALDTATCTVDRSGLVVIGVVRDVAAGSATVEQAMAYVVSVLDVMPTECNDGLDNDRDGQADWPADAQCRSAQDNTEAPVAVAAIGHITIETDAAGAPRMTLTGVFAQPQAFTCRLETSVIQATCVQAYNSELVYACSHFILTAKAFSTSKPLGPGSAKGYVACDNGNSLTTDEVDSSQSLVKTMAEADSYHPHVPLGTAGVVRCRAMGVNGAANATGAFTVDCYEPGVAWPVGSVQDPRG